MIGVRARVDVDPVWIGVGEASCLVWDDVAPFRRVRAHRGQRNFAGHWWMKTLNRHVMFESWCERDNLIGFDFDPDVVGVAAQPFGFRFTDAAGVDREHVPDFYLSTTTGGVVVDVRPDGLVEAVDEEKFDATARLCGELGMGYRRVGDVPPVLMANLRWLAGYRHDRACDATLAARVRAVVEEGKRLRIGAVVEAVGDPVAVLPTVFHLLWSHRLIADVAATVMSMDTMVEAGW
jgi:hypothetical protein